MTWIAILLLATMIVIALNRKSAPAIMNPMLIVLTILVMGLASVRAYRMMRPAPVHKEMLVSYSFAAGHELGQIIATDMPSSSEILIIHEPLTHDFVRFAFDAQLAGIKKGLGSGAYALTVIGMPAPPPAGTEDEEVYIESRNLTVKKLVEYVRSYPNAKALVCATGLPDLVGVNGTKLPPLYILNAADTPLLEEVVYRGYVRAAVAGREDINWEAKPTKKMSPAEVFSQRYVMYRSED